MSDRMTSIAFAPLMDWVLTEYKKSGSVFGVRRAFAPEAGRSLPLFGEKLEVPMGPAAGPNTQLTQNILAAYFAGARFFELKTVQMMDGDTLAACISKPCITAGDECYNCEWSTELTVEAAMDEYIKAWFALKLLTREFGWGDPCGFMFNMSVGYDYDGITNPKIDGFLEGLKDAGQSAIWQECQAWATANLDLFSQVDADYLAQISPRVCSGVTLSTLHGCPPSEIERIAGHLISVKKLNTFVKCNPTILGYDFARKTLDALGFDYVAFDDHHFKADLQHADAVPMFHRLLALAQENGLEFGLKLSNTFPAQVKAGELPAEEMYMSGRSLYPLTIEMARRFTQEFGGKLRLSFSGGMDHFNIAPLFAAGVWPITLATTILKPGGYQRLTQLAQDLQGVPYQAFDGVDLEAVANLAEEARTWARGRKPQKPIPPRKLASKVPLTDCFTAPCKGGCPIGQDIPEYIALLGEGKGAQALDLILEKNPLPHITGTICPHHCTDKCTRGFYEEHIQIRQAKLQAAEAGFDAVLQRLKPTGKSDARVAIVGGGPVGMAAAFFLARSGAKVTLFEKRAQLGGIVRYVIPDFRIGEAAIARDADFLRKLGVDIQTDTLAPSADALLKKSLLHKGYTHVIYAVGAWKSGELRLERGEARNVIDFLEACKDGSVKDLGTDVIIVGGGNTAMDAARAAKRVAAVERVRIVYRRDVRNMPADEEELQLAQEAGVEFCELLAPIALENGTLRCERMRLGEADAGGRRSPMPTGEYVSLPCSTLVAAVGEQVETEIFEQNDIALSARGRVVTDDNCRTKRENVFAIGDARRGPATVVEGIADARAAADAILGVYEYAIPDILCEDCARKKQGILCDCQSASSEDARCLNCGTVCECCAQVCPNRANLSIFVPHHGQQIVHVDKMCNECGNCLVFCPYDSAPYKEKWTLFSTEAEFADSENQGFLPIGARRFKLRYLGEVKEIELGKDHFNSTLESLMETILTEYAYLLRA